MRHLFCWLFVLSITIVLTAACETTTRHPSSVETIVLPVSVADTAENRQAAANRYMRTFDQQELRARIGEEMMARLPEQARVILEGMIRATDLSIVDNAMRDTLVEVYTADELNALAAFYGTDIGKEITGKQNKFLAQMMPILVQALMRHVLSMEDKFSHPLDRLVKIAFVHDRGDG